MVILIASLIIAVAVVVAGMMIHDAIIILVNTNIDIARGMYDATRGGFLDHDSLAHHRAKMRQGGNGSDEII